MKIINSNLNLKVTPNLSLVRTVYQTVYQRTVYQPSEGEGVATETVSTLVPQESTGRFPSETGRGIGRDRKTCST